MVYRMVRTVVYIWLHLRFRIKIEGVHHIPEGSCILAMNHVSNFDPLLVGVHTPRKMFIMAKEELFRSKLFAWLITEMGSFPVKRGSADLKSLKHTLKLLQQGNIFSIFIEGTRSKSGQMQEPKKGIGFLVEKSKAPVIPTYIYGVKGKWGSRAGVIFGPPLKFDTTDYVEIANQVAQSIQNLEKTI
ncbi:MAG TPA: lysophospholipid acyltransferase family protein [Bacillota bacterium]|nr:lysophospholipid acyltransferase family protein [Bacillota bacterium]